MSCPSRLHCGQQMTANEEHDPRRVITISAAQLLLVSNTCGHVWLSREECRRHHNKIPCIFPIMPCVYLIQVCPLQYYGHFQGSSPIQFSVYLLQSTTWTLPQRRAQIYPLLYAGSRERAATIKTPVHMKDRMLKTTLLRTSLRGLYTTRHFTSPRK